MVEAMKSQKTHKRVVFKKKKAKHSQDVHPPSQEEIDKQVRLEAAEEAMNKIRTKTENERRAEYDERDGCCLLQ